MLPRGVVAVSDPSYASLSVCCIEVSKHDWSIHEMMAVKIFLTVHGCNMKMCLYGYLFDFNH